MPRVREQGRERGEEGEREEEATEGQGRKEVKESRGRRKGERLKKG